MSLHFFSASMQPATRYVVDAGDIGQHWITNAGNRLLWCDSCRRRRPAKNLRVQVYYDGLRFSCAPGKGCHARTSKRGRG